MHPLKFKVNSVCGVFVFWGNVHKAYFILQMVPTTLMPAYQATFRTDDVVRSLFLNGTPNVPFLVHHSLPMENDFLKNANI